MLSKNQALAEAFQSIREFVNEQQAHLNRLEQRLIDLNQQQIRVDVLEDYVENFEQQLERFNLLEESLNKLEPLQTHIAFIDKISQTWEQQQASVKSLEKRTGSLETIQTRLAVLENLTHHIEQIKTNINDNIAENVKTLQIQNQGIKKQIEDIKQQQTNLENFKNAIEQLEQPQIHEVVIRLSYLEQALKRINDLETQLNDAELRTREMARALPHAIRQASQSVNSENTYEAELTDSLQKPIELCIKQSISQDTQPFADALFPVMGPAIRKSMNESLKNLVQSINQSVEQSLSMQGLTWRVQAWRSGRSFSEVVLQNTLIYQVEQVFLIHRDTGLLIKHLHQEGVEIGDSDAVSGMFTAIQDFIRDSFSSTKTEELDSVEVGEYTVWLERGPYAVLACVIRGVAPYRFRNTMRSVLETLHGRYGKLLQQFSGDSGSLQVCHSLLENTLQSEKKAEAQTSRRFLSPQFLGLIGTILLLLFGWGYWQFQSEQRFKNYLQALQEAPGIVVVSSQERDGKRFIHGMRDPLANNPAEMAYDCGFENDDIEMQWTPYLDLTQPFIEQRARLRLTPPTTVSIYVEGDVLHLTGHASSKWIQKAIHAPFVTGINHLNTKALLETDQFLLAQAKEELKPPNNITLTVQDRILHFKGFVDSKTYKALQQRLLNLAISEEAFADIDTSHFIDAERERYDLMNTIETTKIYFSGDSAQFSVGQETTLQSLLKNIQKLFVLSQTLSQPTYLQIIGDTDGRGSKSYNQQLSQKRAKVMLNWLEQSGIDKKDLKILSPEVIRFGEPKPNPNYRKVDLKVSFDSPKGNGE
jgi:outer membrane protein OmpA-like peptidoglycan-associated protein